MCRPSVYLIFLFALLDKWSDKFSCPTGPVFSNELRCRNYCFSQLFAQIPCVFFVKLRFIYDAILETFALRKIRKSCDLLARHQEVSQVLPDFTEHPCLSTENCETTSQTECKPCKYY